MNDVPRFIYKFMPINKYVISNLLNNQLWFSSPISFNDPFDCNFFIKSGYNSNYSEEIKSNFVDLGTFQDGQKKSYIPNFRKTFENNPEGFRDFLNEEMIKTLSVLGISCFSDNKKNTLLWSHYADSHKGICLKFDRFKDKETFEANHNGAKCIAISRVNYLNDLSKIPPYRDIMDKIIHVIPFTKSNDWEHEREIRMLIKQASILKFKKSALVEVNFGHKCSNSDLNDITTLIKNAKYSNVVFKKAKKLKTRFGFRFEKLYS